MSTTASRPDEIPTWSEMIERLGETSSLRQIIRESWGRCRAAGIDPDDTPLHRVPDAELECRLQASAELVAAARPYLDWISALIASTPHVVYVADAEGVVLLSTGNDAALMRSAGLDPGFDWSESRMGTNGAGTALATGQAQAVVGTEHYVQAFGGCTCTAAPIRDSEGKLVGAIDISTSRMDAVSERMLLVTHAAHVIQRDLEAARTAALAERRAEEAEAAEKKLRENAVRMRELYEAAAEAARQREDVVAVVSHDLRNPLNAVMAAAALLGEVELSADKKARQVNVITRSAGRMKRLIEDLLDSTSMQAGSFRIHPEPLEARLLVDEAVSGAVARAEDRGLTLCVEVEEAASRLEADRTRILQVLDNLLGNAIRFSPEGGNVRIGATGDGRNVTFSVADEGPGIPPADRPHLFEKFWQGAGGITGGAGLGLTICKGIVEAHGGRIWLDEEVTVGACIRFMIPARHTRPTG